MTALTSSIARREQRRRLLSCVPDAGSGESISPFEVSQRLGVTVSLVQQQFKRLCDRGVLVRLRPGAYQLAPRSSGRAEGGAV